MESAGPGSPLSVNVIVRGIPPYSDTGARGFVISTRFALLMNVAVPPFVGVYGFT